MAHSVQLTFEKLFGTYKFSVGVGCNYIEPLLCKKKKIKFLKPTQAKFDPGEQYFLISQK